jgi:surface polysaccharide O-acyltransferase-like enzyme
MDSVDALRLVAMIGVIIIHTTPFIDAAARAQGQVGTADLVLNQFVRFAIPFFFVVSGYFWGARVRAAPVLPVSGQMLGRLLKLYVFWTLLLLLPWDVSAFAEHGALGPVQVAYWNLQNRLHDPVEILFAGSTQSLWFLMALCWTVAIATLFIRFRQPALLLVVAAALYVFGVLCNYADAPFGIRIPFNTLYGPFCGTLPFTIGYLLSGRTPRAAWLGYGLAVLLAGYVLHFTELLYFWKSHGSYPLKHYDFSTWLLGLGVALVGLANRPFPGRSWMARQGRIALGIYLVQPVFVAAGLLISYYVHSPWWEVGRVLFVLALSILAVRLMMRSRWLRQFVS